MKNKRIMKQGLALLFAVVLLVGGIAIFSANSRAETVAEQLAKEGYTRISPEDFGVTEEKIYTVDGTTVTSVNKAHSSSTVTSINNKYFEAELSITPGSSANTNVFCYWHRYLFRVYVTSANVYVYSSAAPSAQRVVMNQKISDFNMTSSSEYFNFKIATKVTNNADDSANSDVAIRVWINDIEAKLTNSTITVADSYLTNASNARRIRADLTNKGTLKFRPVEEKLPEIPDNLEGYTKMEAADFGITQEVVHSGANISKGYVATNISTFHERYLDADVSLKGGTGYGDGAIAYLGDMMLRMYLASGKLCVYDCQNDTLLYEKAIGDLGITEGEYFHLKWATSISDHPTDSTKSRVTMKLWINNAVVAPLSSVSKTTSVTVNVSKTALAQSMGVLTNESSTAVIRIKPTGWEAVVDPNLPTELAGYKQVTPKNFGITEELLYNTVEAVGSEGKSIWADVTDFNHGLQLLL